MIRSILCLAVLAAAGLSSAQLGGPAPPYKEPIRNGFLTSAETVLDGAHSVNFANADAAIDGQMANLKTELGNLDAMAENEREQIVAKQLHDVVFAMQACRIVATDHQDTGGCIAREMRAEGYAMESMGVHREHSAWVVGAPRWP